MISIDFCDDSQLEIFERYVAGIGMTPRMVTNVDTGENYPTGQVAAERLGVTRQNINNCINGRQATVKGCRLVKSTRLWREFSSTFKEYCDAQGTDYWDVISEVRERLNREN